MSSTLKNYLFIIKVSLYLIIYLDLANDAYDMHTYFTFL